MPVDNQDYVYYAFISYNWRDARWARWLQRRLEHYNLPSIARREIGRDVKIRPVFRYETDLGAADLRRDLPKELAQSRYLVVICSPHSAFPNVKGEHWVDDEIRHFIALGRTDRIIPVIVAGSPDSTGPDRCFPPALADAGIAGISVKKEGRGCAIQKIVAKLLGLRPDILIDRWHRDLRRKHLLTAFCFIPLFLLAAVTGLFIWDSVRPVTACYADYVDSFGLPRGIFPLSERDVQGRDCLYRFRYRGLRHGESPHQPSMHEPQSLFAPFGFHRVLRRVEQTSAIGHPKRREHTEFADRSPILDFSYDGNRLSEIRHGEFAGSGAPPRLLKREVFLDEGNVTNGLVEFKGEENASFLNQASRLTSLGLDFNSRKTVPRSKIAKHRIERDGQGRPLFVYFLDAAGNPLPDGDGVWGWAFVHDDFGRRKEWWYLDRAGNRTENGLGVAGRRYEYKRRNIKRAYYVNSSQQPVVSQHGWAVCENRFDDKDRNIATRFFDAKDHPVLSVADAVAGFDREFDARGNEIRTTAIGLDGKPVLQKEGIVGMTREFDDYGNETKRSYFGLDGNPALHMEGHAGWTSEFDNCGNETKRSFFGIDGKPTLHVKGHAGWTSEFDARGNETKRSYFGLDGSPACHVRGHAGWTRQFDEHGNLTRFTLLGIDGEPVLVKDGFAGWRSEFDDRGNETKRIHLGVDGNPLLFEDGSIGWTSEFDDRGNETKYTAIGIDGNPVLLEDGSAGCLSEFDDRGHETKRSYFDTDGNLTLHVDGIAGWTSEFDDRGHETKRSYFDTGGNPTLHVEGMAGWTSEFDNYGHEIKRSYFDTAGNPALYVEGYATWTREFDDRGHETKRSFFDTGGNPTLHMDGYAGWIFEFDDRGNLTKSNFFDVDGTPMFLEVDYAEGNLTLVWTKEFDDQGNLIDNTFFEIETTPVASPEDGDLQP